MPQHVPTVRKDDVTEPLSPAERARRYRRRNGIRPRAIYDDPLSRARRRLRTGDKMADLEPEEAEAIRAYNRDRKKTR